MAFSFADFLEMCNRQHYIPLTIFTFENTYYLLLLLSKKSGEHISVYISSRFEFEYQDLGHLSNLEEVDISEPTLQPLDEDEEPPEPVYRPYDILECYMPTNVKENLNDTGFSLLHNNINKSQAELRFEPQPVRRQQSTRPVALQTQVKQMQRILGVLKEEDDCGVLLQQGRLLLLIKYDKSIQAYRITNQNHNADFTSISVTLGIESFLNNLEADDRPKISLNEVRSVQQRIFTLLLENINYICNSKTIQTMLSLQNVCIQTHQNYTTFLQEHTNQTQSIDTNTFQVIERLRNMLHFYLLWTERVGVDLYYLQRAQTLNMQLLEELAQTFS